MRSHAVFCAFAVAACSAGSSGSTGLNDDSGATTFDVGAGEGGVDSGGFDPDVATDVVDTGASCDPPDMLIVLDRTDSMAATPSGSRPPNTPAGRATSKWFLAVDAVDKVTAAVDKTVRFGLELFPLDPGGGKCITEQALLAGGKSTNASCQPGEIVVEPALGASGAIAAAIPPETTTLCVSTPIGAALNTAGTELTKVKTAGRKQFVVFVSDGGDTCSAKSDPLAVTDSLFASGVGTYIISFDASGGGGGVNMKLLNDLACAGGTAIDAATNCTGTPKSRAKVSVTTPLYYTAKDETELTDKLKSAVGDVCCSCGIH